VSAGPWWEGGRPVVITGGGGFLGGQLALRLARIAPPGARVVVVDDDTRRCLDSLAPALPAGIVKLRADVRDAGRWLPEVGAASVIVHCAALAGVSTYYQRPHDVLAVNGLGTVALVEAAVTLAPALFLNLSTSEVYGANAAGAREDGPAAPGPVGDPRWTYATSKLFAESWVLMAHRAGRLPAVSLRPFNVYGPGQLGEGAVRNFCEAAVRGLPLRVTGDGRQRRSWCHVDDFLDALFAVAADSRHWGRAYNVGDEGRRVEMGELARRIQGIAGMGSPVELVPHQGQDVLERWPDTTSIRSATGWAPRVDLDVGLRQTVAWWRERVRPER
jgi:nucleoside-diphosphate-sugar epimerase